MRAIETMGSMEKSGFLKLDVPLYIDKKQKVKVIILYNESDEISDGAWLNAISTNPAFDFLKDKKEDIYSIADGKPMKK